MSTDHGFTLVELMIAMALGVIITLCATQSAKGIFALHQRVVRDQINATFLSESSLFAFDEAYASGNLSGWKVVQDSEECSSIVSSDSPSDSGILFSGACEAQVESTDSTNLLLLRARIREAEEFQTIFFFHEDLED